MGEVEKHAGEQDERGGDDELKVFYPLGHYYSPLPDTRELAKEPERSRIWPNVLRSTPGIDWRGEAQTEFWRDLSEQYLIEFAIDPTGDPHEYYTHQEIYPELDGWILQAMIRHLKPARMIEVGSGMSSLLTARVNREFLGGRLHFTCIEPQPPPYLDSGVPGISDLRAERIQDTPLDLFDELGQNDILFIDTSHTVKTGGDVTWIYHEIIPRLRPGVVIHMHDVFIPGDYPWQWVLEGWGWNESYLVQSFLAFNWAFEVVLGVHWLKNNYSQAIEAAPALAEILKKPGSSFWIKRADE